MRAPLKMVKARPLMYTCSELDAVLTMGMGPEVLADTNILGRPAASGKALRS